jgi:hypothetical protein
MNKQVRVMNPKDIVKENFTKLDLLTNKFKICILHKLIEIYRHPVDAISLIFIYLTNLYHKLAYIIIYSEF